MSWPMMKRLSVGVCVCLYACVCVCVCVCVSVCVFVFISFHHRGFFRLQWYRRHTWVYETSVLCYGGHDIGFFFQFDWYPVPFIFHPKRQNYDFAANWKENQYVKSVQIRVFFWSVFSRIWTEYGEIRSTFHAVNDMRYDARQRWMEGYIFDIGYNLTW